MHLQLPLLVLSFLSPASAYRETTVRKTSHGPTGYVVDFIYRHNGTTQPSSVTVGGINYLSDAPHASVSKSSGYSPYAWKPGQFSYQNFATSDVNANVSYAGFNMTYNDGEALWELSLPLPSQTYQYAFYPDCKGIWPSCAGFIDEGNLPIEARRGDQVDSVVEVPANRRYSNLDYTYQFPVKESARGEIAFYEYPSPGLTYPSPNVHSTGVYLPAGYHTNPNKVYPVLYLSHGGGGNDSDWFNVARAHQIMDHLILEKYLEPTIVVTPNFYDLGFTTHQYATNRSQEGFDVEGYNAFYNAVAANYKSHLIPFIESKFRADSTQSRRAFAGLSLGGGLTATMLFNATETFGTYNVMSNIPFPVQGDPIYQTPGLKDVGIFLSAGFYDIAFQNSINSGARLDAAGLSGYQNYYFPEGGHQWASWQAILWTWGKGNWWDIKPAGGGPLSS
nr:hypothetical protein B0A51_13171 [Rachicladosporium sp. CCFEE 5018]